MNGRINVALIYGRTRKGRFCDKVVSAAKGMAMLLARLNWWSTALRAARRATPYAQVIA